MGAVVNYPEPTKVTVEDSGETIVLSLAATQGPQGPTGNTGATGATGERGGVPYIFSTDTADSNPAAGFFRFNSTTPSSVTQMYISARCVPSLDVTTWLASWDDSTSSIKGYITLRSRPDTGTLTRNLSIDGPVTVNGTTLATRYYTVPVTFLSGNSVPNNDSELSFEFSRTGDLGEAGSTGATGAQGIQGIQGVPGDLSPAGQAAEAAAIAAAAAASVSQSAASASQSAAAASQSAAATSATNSATSASTSQGYLGSMQILTSQFFI